MRLAKKMAAMRSAKERKRLERGPRDEEPKMIAVRHPFISWAMRDDLSGEIVWMEMKSARDTMKRISVLLKYYQPIASRYQPASQTGKARLPLPP